MPRLVNRPPGYCHHKGSGQAYVTINGKPVYLGTYKSPESRAEYSRIIGEWTANHGVITKPGGRRASASIDMTVAELLLKFWEHCKEWYRRPDGSLTTEPGNFKPVIRLVRKSYGDTAAIEFGAIGLRAVRQQMIDVGWSRKSINRQVGRVRQIWNWGRGQQMIPSSDAYLSLEHVEPLQTGRSKAIETEPVKPVPAPRIKAIRPYLSRQVEAMLDLQLLTGMRPGEVCGMRGCDLKTDGSPWEYRPLSHKTAHHGHERVIYLGPKAQAIVEPFLKTDTQAHLFSPADAIREMREESAKNRKTPLNQGNTPKPDLDRRVKKKFGSRYNVAAYDHAITKACEKAFGMPDEIREPRRKEARAAEATLPPEAQKKRREERMAARSKWRAQNVWSPNQLRHNAATELRKKHGIDVAQTILGHRLGSSITEIYAEANVDKARDVMAKIG